MSGHSSDDVKHEVDARRHAGAGEALAILDIEAILADARRGREARELGDAGVMSRAVMAVEQAGAHGEQRARADRHETNSRPRRAREPIDDRRLVNGVLVAAFARDRERRLDAAGNDDQRAIRQTIRQRRHAGDLEADGVADARRGTDISSHRRCADRDFRPLADDRLRYRRQHQRQRLGQGDPPVPFSRSTAAMRRLVPTMRSSSSISPTSIQMRSGRRDAPAY